MKEDEEDNLKADFESDINEFIKHIESQSDIVPLMMSLLRMKLVQESKHLNSYIKDNIDVKDLNEGEPEEPKKQLLIPEDKFKDFIALTEQIQTSSLAYDLLPINFMVSFVS